MSEKKSRVKSLIGITESELVSLQPEAKEQYINREKSVFINKFTPYGYFQIKTVSELRKNINDLPNYEKSTLCTFEILEDIDIGNIKVQDKSMVQVASNFNCLEIPNRDYDRNCGYLVEKSHLDSTQGPAACFGPLAGSWLTDQPVSPEKSERIANCHNDK